MENIQKKLIVDSTIVQIEVGRKLYNYVNLCQKAVMELVLVIVNVFEGFVY